jgi:hypothetical protein
MTRLLWAASAVLCTTAAVLVWFTMRIGPVVVIVSHRHDHALHLGDVVIGLPLALAAVASSVLALPVPRRQGARARR